jgi:predicted RNA polymerase sigma factor
LHARALAAADTDWLQIAVLYGELARRQMHDLHHVRHRVRVTSAAGVDRDLIAWLRAACHQA